MATVSLMSMTKKALAKELGCGDCTMASDWRTESVQKPGFCLLNEKFIYCPIFGFMPHEWEKFYEKAMFLFVDDRQDIGINQIM